METVAVMLSSYNGENYLEEQISSILSQEGVGVYLYIRDDGSSDSTEMLLQRYSNDNRISIIRGENVGCKSSFYKLAEIAYASDMDFQYFAFSDQDDVWCQGKLRNAISVLEAKKQTTPCLYGSNYNLVDKNLNYIGYKKNKSKFTFGESLFSNSVIGCSMVFNKALLKLFLMSTPSDMFMHDCYIKTICLGVGGEFFFDQNPNLLYRQHGHNVIGGIRSKKERMASFLSSITTQNSYAFDTAVSMKKNYRGLLTEDALRLTDEVLSYKNSVVKKLNLLVSRELETDSISSNLKVKLQILFNKF